MAVTKTTHLRKIEVYPTEADDRRGQAPVMSVHLVDIWDDPEDDELPVIKDRKITRGKAVPELDEIERTPVDDLPELAQQIGNLIWDYD